MTQKTKKSVTQHNQEEEILMSNSDKGMVYSITLYVRSFIVIAVVLCMFVLFCHLSFKIMDILTPLLKIGIGVAFAYLLVMNEHFHHFRQTLLNPSYGPVALWNDFLKGMEGFIGTYLGRDWLKKFLSSIKRS